MVGVMRAGGAMVAVEVEGMITMIEEGEYEYNAKFREQVLVSCKHMVTFGL